MFICSENKRTQWNKIAHQRPCMTQEQLGCLPTLNCVLQVYCFGITVSTQSQLTGMWKKSSLYFHGNERPNLSKGHKYSKDIAKNQDLKCQ